MKIQTGLTALIFGIFILIFVNASIYLKERHLSQGEIIYLELAPVDPRSLMQGDYMALNFAIGRDIENNPEFIKLHADNETDYDIALLKISDGKIIALLDKNRVASFSQLDDGRDLKADEIRLFYRIRNGEIKFATNAFFFREGTAEIYENAKYGKFRVNSGGEVVLTDMCDKDFKVLGVKDPE